MAAISAFRSQSFVRRSSSQKDFRSSRAASDSMSKIPLFGGVAKIRKNF